MGKSLDDGTLWKPDNPKRRGSLPWQRYNEYSRAKTVREALFLGAKQGDIRWDEAAGFMTRTPKPEAEKPTKKRDGATKQAKQPFPQKGKIMNGVISDGSKYFVGRFFCYLGIQARNKSTMEDAQACLRAIDRVHESVMSKNNRMTMTGKTSSLEDFVRYVKASVAKERKASPDLGVEKWRYYAAAKADSFAESSLKKLRKDPQISISDAWVRVLQDGVDDGLRGWLKFAKAMGHEKMSDVSGIDGLNAGRRAADKFAEETMANIREGERPTDAQVLRALRLWGFEKSRSRQNVLPEGREWVHSDTLGLLETKYGSHDMAVTAACRGHENFVRLLCSWARRRSPGGVLPFTTISLNKNYAGRLHRDSGNVGPSIGVAIGPYTGGGLRFWADDPGRGSKRNVEGVRKEPSALLDIRKGVVFDGNCAHEVQPFEGERYSLIFFTVKKYKKADPSVKRKMIQMGADWPSDVSLKRLQAQIPRSSAK
jgi:hypothetical protein